MVVFDWKSRTAAPLDPEGWQVTLAPLGWDYRVIAPVLAGGIAVIGDTGLYATVGDRRIANIEELADGVAITVLNPDETVEVIGWAEGSDGLWRRAVEPSSAGWTRLEVRSP